MSREQAKAKFLTAYRALCEEHGFMVLPMEEDGYTCFRVAHLHRPAMDQAVQEMLHGSIFTIAHEGAFDDPESA